MTQHIVSAFTDELDALSADVLRMGGLAEAMVGDACQAVTTADAALAEKVMHQDADVDALEIDIEKRITRLLALRQPLAADLRAVLAAFKIAGDLERIGDLSKNIARRTREIERADHLETLKGVSRMGSAVALQMQTVLDAYSTRDETLAVRVWNSDDDIDQHYNALFRETLTYMMEDPRLIGAGAHLMFIAKNLERIGDHCTNIAEVVFYQVTGAYMPAEARPKSPLIDT